MDKQETHEDNPAADDHQAIRLESTSNPDPHPPSYQPPEPQQSTPPTGQQETPNGPTPGVHHPTVPHQPNEKQNQQQQVISATDLVQFS